MTGDLQNRLDSLCRKAILLSERYQVLAQSKARAEQRIAELEQELEQTRGQVAELQQQNKYLSLTQAVNPTPDDVERSRKVISELVRQIDRCINELND